MASNGDGMVAKKVIAIIVLGDFTCQVALTKAVDSDTEPITEPPQTLQAFAGEKIGYVEATLVKSQEKQTYIEAIYQSTGQKANKKGT